MKTFISFSLVSVLLAMLWLPTTALADLQVFPTRLTIDSRARTGVFNLRHIGTKTTRYRITPVFYRMKSDGSMEKIAEPVTADRYAGDMIIFSPRMVALEPGKEQVVRIQVRRPPALADGEYRMHLQFETFDDVDAMQVAEGKDEEKGVNMALKAHRAIAVPVIVYQGLVTAGVEVKNPVLDPKSGGLTLTLEKSGNRSVYGDLVLEYKTGNDWQKLSEVRGVAVYDQVRQMQMSMDGNKVPAKAPLRISFTEQIPRGVSTVVEIPGQK